MSTIDYAERELDLIGMNDEEGMNGMMRKHLIHMVEEFAKEGHSGFSASYALSCLKRLLAFKPLSPLTGEEDEWTEVSEHMGHKSYQNKRYSAVFKDETGTYNIDGKVFWSWFTDKDTGEKFKSYYTSRDSRVYVEFPYAVPDEPEYEYREDE